jgi:glycosyltransferase involved in cell wall biosynthesis
MKIALVHDFLCGFGGSERVFQYMCEAFPDADAYTLAYNPAKTLPYFKNRNLKTTWMNPIVQTSSAFRWSFPIATYAMQSLNMSEYDLVISSSATVAKYVKVPAGRHICYCYMPTRAIWRSDVYFGEGVKASILKYMVGALKKRDYDAAQKVDHFIAISDDSRNYIKQYYIRDADVLFCPIETDKFYPAPKRKDHYLIVSRLEHWKKTDYAIEAFNKLGLPLRVIGSGAEEKKLRALARDNITFLGGVDDETLAKEYSECKAVVFTPFLEYGLIPLEANASGAAVICYGKGGVTETMIPLGSTCGKAPTAVFFYEQTAEALIQAVRQFESHAFPPQDLVAHAQNWTVGAFQKALKHKAHAFLQAAHSQL